MRRGDGEPPERPPDPSVPALPEAEPAVRGQRGPGRRRLAAGLAAVAVLATAAGVAVALEGSGPRHRQRTTPVASVPIPIPSPFGQTNPLPRLPQTIPQPQPQAVAPQPASQQSPPAYGPVVYWLGMQIQATSPGIVMIDTVHLGSEADRVGLEPGEQLLSVDGHQLTSAADIAPAIRGLAAGHQVTIQAGYGSAAPQTSTVILGAPPTRHP